MQLDAITKTVLRFYPSVQGVYLFGSYMTEDEWPDSDVDIALLLPPEEAIKERSFAMSECSLALASALNKDVDLLNARTVSTVFQNEIISKGKLLYCADRYAVDEFEMLTLSYYQKLNEERADIIASALADGRFINV
jgi:predicted nucleotidyltransferase